MYQITGGGETQGYIADSGIIIVIGIHHNIKIGKFIEIMIE